MGELCGGLDVPDKLTHLCLFDGRRAGLARALRERPGGDRGDLAQPAPGLGGPPLAGPLRLLRARRLKKSAARRNGFSALLLPLPGQSYRHDAELLLLHDVPNAAFAVARDIARLVIVLVEVERLSGVGPLQAAVRALDDRQVAGRLVGRRGGRRWPTLGARPGAGRYAGRVLVEGVERHPGGAHEKVAQLGLLLLERSVVLGQDGLGSDPREDDAGADDQDELRAAHAGSPLPRRRHPARGARRAPYLSEHQRAGIIPGSRARHPWPRTSPPGGVTAFAAATSARHDPAQALTRLRADCGGATPGRGRRPGGIPRHGAAGGRDQCPLPA